MVADRQPATPPGDERRQANGGGHHPQEWGTAVNVQAMVYGNTGEASGSGVAFTRNPANGTNEFYGEFLINAQGEDVVAGVRTPEPVAKLQKQMPKPFAELMKVRASIYISSKLGFCIFLFS